MIILCSEFPIRFLTNEELLLRYWCNASQERVNDITRCKKQLLPFCFNLPVICLFYFPCLYFYSICKVFYIGCEFIYYYWLICLHNNAMLRAYLNIFNRTTTSVIFLANSLKIPSKMN